MDRLLIAFYAVLDRFERWFDRNFGWFFTNGMKDQYRRRRPYTHKG